MFYQSNRIRNGDNPPPLKASDFREPRLPSHLTSSWPPTNHLHRLIGSHRKNIDSRSLDSLVCLRPNLDSSLNLQTRILRYVLQVIRCLPNRCLKFTRAGTSAVISGVILHHTPRIVIKISREFFSCSSFCFCIQIISYKHTTLQIKRITLSMKDTP